MKFFLTGSRFIEKLSGFSNDKSLEVCGIETDISPLCDYDGIGNVDNWTESLLNNSKLRGADHLIIDLRGISSYLFKKSGKLYTLSKRNEELVDNEVKYFSWGSFGLEIIEKKIRELAYVFSNAGFGNTKKNIFLICSNMPAYYVIDRQIRRNEKYPDFKRDIEIMKRAERFFSKAVKTVNIKLEDFYFLKKEAGYELTDYIYEDECYKNIWDQIKNFCEGSDYSFDRPDISYSLDRVCRYYYHTILVKAFLVFLDYDHLIEGFIYDSTKEYLNENRAGIINMHYLYANAKQNDCDDDFFLWLISETTDNLSDLISVLFAYNDLRKNGITNSTSDCRKLFYKSHFII